MSDVRVACAEQPDPLSKKFGLTFPSNFDIFILTSCLCKSDFPENRIVQGTIGIHSTVAQWWSIRLLTGGLLVRAQPGEHLHQKRCGSKILQRFFILNPALLEVVPNLINKDNITIWA